MKAILTDEQHESFVHPCGRTGAEISALEDTPNDPCEHCVIVEQCEESHGIIGFDICPKCMKDADGCPGCELEEKDLSKECWK